MGLIEKVATAVVKGVVEDAAIGALDVTIKAVDGAGKGIKAAGDAVGGVIDKTFGDKDTRHYRKEQKYLSKNPDSTYLIIQKENIKRDIFSVYDTDENVRYFVQGKLSSNKSKVNLQLLDANKLPIGTVKKTFMSLRAPVFHESNPADYIIEIRGQQTATLKTKLSTKQENYEIEPYDWIVKGSILKWDFTVMDGEDEIVHISKRKGYDSPTYILDFPNRQHEVIGLMIVLTIICRG